MLRDRGSEPEGLEYAQPSFRVMLRQYIHDPQRMAGFSRFDKEAQLGGTMLEAEASLPVPFTILARCRQPAGLVFQGGYPRSAA